MLFEDQTPWFHPETVSGYKVELLFATAVALADCQSQQIIKFL